MGAIELKEQFLSSKRDKMSELVKRMFEKQLVSPRSYEFQMKSLDRRYQQENQQLETMRRQAEQLSSMLSEIKKDKEEIQDIDELIRNEKWEEAQKLVQHAEHLPPAPEHALPVIAEREEQEKWESPRQ
jgi:N-methylhydantoinase A/oxoprolinase/acetone carboxylase beta subunit